jgi:CDP-glycerol glycerophosphotransferase (TagB/SpsB family)
LNDRLKQDKTEVAHVLKEAPIKDLRKGIGINDRFTFVRELFRGDEAFYERSIKNINSFHIFSEAEYWINRELKYKMGWDEDKEAVKHFYQLVRRRFS